MDNKVKIYIAILVLLFGITLLVDKGQPKPIDWTPTYSVNDKIPFGLYVFDQEAKSFFKNQKIKRIATETPYEYLDSQYDDSEGVENYKVKGNFINISEVKLVIFDNKPLELTITSPKDGTELFGKNNQVVDIQGESSKPDSQVIINNSFVIVGKDGSFLHRLQLQNGSNEIKVVASDKAGNSAETKITLVYTP